VISGNSHDRNNHQWNTSYNHNLRSISVLPSPTTEDESKNTTTPQHASTASPPSELTKTLEELYSLLLTRVPKGFENFLPKNARTGNTDSNPPDDDKKKEPKKNNNTQHQSSSSGGDKKKKEEENRRRKKKEDEEMQQQLAGATLLLIIVMMARSFLEDDGVHMGGDGPEVTWADFYNYMLTEGDVERIVVVNQKTARVYLRPGARGVPVGVSLRGMSRQSKEKREEMNKSGGGVHHDESWDDGTIMEMNGTTSTKQASRGFPGVSMSAAPKHQLVYHFNIGSVESFEDKLSRSQQELNISPRDYVPVQYANETNWMVELVKSAPALFLIGMTAYMLKGMGGMPGAGGGRGGGMGGIFSMGKSNAKLIKKEDVNVTFKDVAGCLEAKKEIMEFVDFLQDATQFTKLGAKIPKGALLTGPPGTGE
jgi:AFG3 family protein